MEPTVYRFCPSCGGALEKRGARKPPSPSGWSAARADSSFYLDPKVAVGTIIRAADDPPRAGAARDRTGLRSVGVSRRLRRSRRGDHCRRRSARRVKSPASTCASIGSSTSTRIRTLRRSSSSTRRRRWAASCAETTSVWRRGCFSADEHPVGSSWRSAARREALRDYFESERAELETEIAMRDRAVSATQASADGILLAPPLRMHPAQALFPMKNNPCSIWRCPVAASAAAVGCSSYDRTSTVGPSSTGSRRAARQLGVVERRVPRRAACTDFRWNVTEQTATVAQRIVQRDVRRRSAGVGHRERARCRDRSITWTAQGTARVAGSAVLPDPADSGTAELGVDSIRVPYSGETCLGPASRSAVEAVLDGKQLRAQRRPPTSRRRTRTTGAPA